MDIRLAFPNEADQIMSTIIAAKELLAEAGSSQWQESDSYPNQSDIFSDILQGKGYIGLIDGEIVAYGAVVFGHEAAYDAIYDGQWQHNNQLYTSLRRIVIAPNYRGQGLAQTFLQGLIEGYDAHDFRCDTHVHNASMQHILEKLDFVYCGKVPVNGERLAYQKIKKKSEKALYQEIDEAAHHSL
ncbi:GNAT family N-acetyltransferase [Streptococcus dentapri]|uniref:GNAT family N-acetyltransferase n=1 Tax=Streptococcus dentapri TaxID=573564 RepID=A0ABV8CZ75_9STRE